MLRPSYSDLLEVLNKDNNEKDPIASRYTIVMAVAKRARQLVDGADPLAENCKVDKPVSIAVQELYEQKIEIKQLPKTMPEEKKVCMSEETENNNDEEKSFLDTLADRIEDDLGDDFEDDLDDFDFDSDELDKE